MPRRLVAVLALATAAALTAGLAGCGAAAGSGPTEDELYVYSGRSKELVDPLLQEYAKDTGSKLFIRYGGSAELAAQLLEEGDRSEADVFFSQDAGALGALAKAGRLAALPQPVLDRVDPRYRADDGTWVGVSARSRVIAYDPAQVDDVPDSVLGLTDPQWKGKVGYAPTNASFQAFVTGMRTLLGEERTREWLTGMRANDIQAYENNIAVLDAVDRGEIALGLINHYYWYEKVAELGEDNVNARIAFLHDGDPGALVNVAGAGIVETTDKPDAAQRFVEWLLQERAQTYFAETTAEYPLLDGVPTVAGLPPLGSLDGPEIDLSDLDSLDRTLALLDETGLT